MARSSTRKGRNNEAGHQRSAQFREHERGTSMRRENIRIDPPAFPASANPWEFGYVRLQAYLSSHARDSLSNSRPDAMNASPKSTPTSVKSQGAWLAAAAIVATRAASQPIEDPRR
jgi:hypothetical protein